MTTEFEVLNKAKRASIKKFPDQIVVVFRKLDGRYYFFPESEFLGDEKQITERYLNGEIVKYL
jgi:hypothetical protein